MDAELTILGKKLKEDFLRLKESEDIKNDTSCNPVIEYIGLLFDLCEIKSDSGPINDIKSILLALISTILYHPNQLREKAHIIISALIEPLDEQIRIARALMNARPYGSA